MICENEKRWPGIACMHGNGWIFACDVQPINKGEEKIIEKEIEDNVKERDRKVWEIQMQIN